MAVVVQCRAVVRNTFLELEFFEVGRPRSLTDSCLDAMEFSHFEVDISKCDNKSTISDADTDADVSCQNSNSGSWATDSEDEELYIAYSSSSRGVISSHGSVIAAPQSVSKGNKKSTPIAKASNKSKAITSSRDTRTSVMLRNLPRAMCLEGLINLLNKHGFHQEYTFAYVPVDMHSFSSLGYAFVDCISPDVVSRLWSCFDGLQDWLIPGEKACQVCWSDDQGLADHIARWRNSPIMHQSMQDCIRPAMFENGVRIAFPAPTKTIRAPRLRPVHNNRRASSAMLRQ